MSAPVLRRALRLLTFLLFVLCQTSRADSPLVLDAGSAHDMEVRGSSSGEMEIHTTGRDPFVRTAPLQANADLTRNHILAFEYFSLTGVNSVKVYLAPGESEAVSVGSEALGRSEGWTVFSVDLAPALAAAKGRNPTALRIDFGTQRDRTIKIRDLKLRPLTEQEKAFIERAAAQKAQAAEIDRALQQYLSAKFPGEVTRVRATVEQITVEGTIRSERGDLVLLELPIFAEPMEIGAYRAAGQIHADAAGHFTATLERHPKSGGAASDRLFSRWAIGRRSGTGFTLLSHARYAGEISAASNAPEEKLRGRKGVGGLSMGRPLSDLDELGISAATVNVMLNFMHVTPGQGRTAFEYGGKTWYTDDGAIAGLDRTLLEAAKRHIIISAIILVNQAKQASDPYAKILAHPDAHPSGHFAMPNVSSPEGHLAYAAAIEFLAQRYGQPGGTHGRIHHWIIHNEVDAGWEWTNAGEKSALRYLDLYQRSMRTVHLIVRQYDPHAKTFISLTHYWAKTTSPHFYPGRDLLELLLSYCRAEGDFEWAIAHHPYPQDLRNPRTWEDKLAQFSFDTPQITFKNIEVLDAWVRQPRTFFGGKPRSVHLTEQAPNSPDYSDKSLREQAAAMAYLWKKLERLPTIQAFDFHNWVDNRNEGGLRIGLRRFPDDQEEPLGKKPVWYVYQALDTPGEAKAIEFAKEIIGIKEWSEVQYKGEIK